ncbi:iron chelate uptake ABC transporter family permease subunit [Acetobacterium paludosum]|uniref:Iron chelate uptake ABC transporter family permease subunit n=1 Tax=Acetobacterium paludosum TaxID=52693 RepID=A0A923KX29_9FIRM|nr:iron ABC transporter permease [Acetobacterium paludosum]MBC3887871.1 iron chelate uptake ABC transporter family permease subunit [Acetobacterium paludosum]
MKMTKIEKTTMAKNIEQAKLDYMNKRSRKILFILLLALALVMTAIVSITLGAASVDLKTVIQVIGDLFVHNDAITDIQRDIVFSIRLPRIITAILVGMALSNAGLLMQGIFQNPLVSPYTLGVSNGASFGASLAIVFSSAFAFLNFGEFLLPIFAFAFAVLTMMMVYGIAKVASNSSSTLILAGVAIGYLFSALVSLIKYVSDMKDLPELVFWMMGSLSGVPTVGIVIMTVSITVSIILMMWFAWDLNIMSAGEETAVSLGVNYKKVKMMSFGISTLLTAVAVSFTGVIGFVGLVAPHITKMLIGNDYRYSVPAASLVGALLLLIADTIGRNIISPTILPVGIVTSMIGVPFFLYLIVRKRGK